MQKRVSIICWQAILTMHVYAWTVDLYISYRVRQLFLAPRCKTPFSLVLQYLQLLFVHFLD